MSPEIAMLVSLMNFASYSTGLPTPNYLPPIVWQPRCVINEHFLGRCDTEQAYVAALYDHEKGIIFLSEEDVDLSTLNGKATVLHELVHYIQYVALSEGNVIVVDQMNSKSCMRGALEPPAYKAQFEWILENHRDPWVESKMGWYTYYQAVACRPIYEEMRGEG